MTELSAIEALLTRARSGLERVQPEHLAEEIADGAIVIDIRPIDQRRRDGELPGATVVDRNVLEWRLDPTSAHRLPIASGHEVRFVLVCNEGYSSSLAAATLQQLGLHRATDLVGGFQAWQRETVTSQMKGRRFVGGGSTPRTETRPPDVRRAEDAR